MFQGVVLVYVDAPIDSVYKHFWLSCFSGKKKVPGKFDIEEEEEENDEEDVVSIVQVCYLCGTDGLTKKQKYVYLWNIWP